MKGIIEYRLEFFDLRPGFPGDLLKKKQQIVHGILLDARVGSPLNRVHEHIRIECGGFRAFGMRQKQVKIIERIPPGLFDDKLPVAVRVGQFFEKDGEAFHKPEIIGQ